MDWGRFTRKVPGYYRGKGEKGQVPYNPTIILKMLLLSYLWNVLERMIEVLASDSLSIGFLLGFGADEKSPDHSTLTLFKNRLIQGAGLKAYEELFDEIISMTQEKGVKFGQLQIVDSVHLVADVNLGKDKQRQRATTSHLYSFSKGKKALSTAFSPVIELILTLPLCYFRAAAAAFW